MQEGLSLVLAALQHESSHSRTALLLNSAGGLGEGSLAPLERGLLAMLTRADKPVPGMSGDWSAHLSGRAPAAVVVSVQEALDSAGDLDLRG